MRRFGLIGWPLNHSFSLKYFTEKFAREGIDDAQYELFPLEKIVDLPGLLKAQPDLCGFNVTIPHKQRVIEYLDVLHESAQKVGAVNCVKKTAQQQWMGFNTDVLGFEKSFSQFLAKSYPGQDKTINQAFVLGTGGAAKAVAFVLEKLYIPYKLVSRQPRYPNEIIYTDLQPTTSSIQQPVSIINASPLGTYPDIDQMPPIPLEILRAGNLVYDLVYNPAETLLLREARLRGCFVQNGLEMLHLQADAAWKIWQT